VADAITRARSNYFPVRDRALFEDQLRQAVGEAIEVVDRGGGEIALLAGRTVGQICPSTPVANEVEFDIAAFVSPHLVDDSVAAFISAGGEKLRYVIGEAIAINARGERRRVSLDDIYELAEQLGSDVTDASY
jgi:hypothetical protein